MRLLGNSGVIKKVLEEISDGKSLSDIRIVLQKRSVTVTISGQKICPADVGELIQLFYTEPSVTEEMKQRFFGWLDPELQLMVNQKNSSSALNNAMKQRLNREFLIRFLYAKARIGATTRKLLEALRRAKIPQPVDKDDSVIDNQWCGVGQYQFYEYLSNQGELARETARMLYALEGPKTQTKLAKIYDWIAIPKK